MVTAIARRCVLARSRAHCTPAPPTRHVALTSLTSLVYSLDPDTVCTARVSPLSPAPLVRGRTPTAVHTRHGVAAAARVPLAAPGSVTSRPVRDPGQYGWMPTYLSPQRTYTTSPVVQPVQRYALTAL